MEFKEKLPQFLISMLKEQYGDEIVGEIIKGYVNKRNVTFRVNTLKTNIEKVEKELQESEVEYEKVPWSKEAFIIKNVTEKEIEKLELYKNGEIYLQSLSSMLPPIILDPKEDTDILDMAAAPGGKTTQLAALTQNKANITACEINKIRCERLRYNIEKQGATSVYIMQEDSRKINDFFSFDQILLDAPCSRKRNIKYGRCKSRKKFHKKINRKIKAGTISIITKSIKSSKTRS